MIFIRPLSDIFLNSFSGGFIRQINKDIEITVDGTRTGFRLTKPDAFSGVTLLRLLMPLEEKDEHPTMLDPVPFLSVEELHSVMTAVPNHTSVLLPAGRKQRQIQSLSMPEIQNASARSSSFPL